MQLLSHLEPEDQDLLTEPQVGIFLTISMLSRAKKSFLSNFWSKQTKKNDIWV